MNNTSEKNSIKENDIKTLIVVVLDDNSNPTQGASVSITPSDASGLTNSSGEIQFTLGNFKKYDITATFNRKTVTVPYYVTEGGASRIVVNPIYIKSVEDQLNPPWFKSQPGVILGFGILVVVLFIIFWKLFKRKK